MEDGGQNNAYDCNCQCGPLPVSQTLSIVSSSDDAEEFLGPGIINLASTDLEFTLEDGVSHQLVGMRFAPLGIPKGATILSAKIQFTADETTSPATTLMIQGQASDNAPTFTATNFDISSRPRTTASVPWSPPPWTVLDQAGPDQLTPELGSIVQELVNRPGWTPASAAVFIVTGDGWRAAWAWDRSPANAPRLTVQYQEPGIAVPLSVCVPPGLNPNLAGGVAPTPADLTNDCQMRVQNTVSGLAGACGYPSVCTCTVDASTQSFATACDDPCTEVPLAPGCTNFDPKNGHVTATNADGDMPVCLTHSPLSSGLYGQRSRCEVSGVATVDVEDEDTKVTPASGVVEFVGPLCPGQSCAVGMAYSLKLAPITYSHLFGSATFRDLMSTGASSPGNEVLLDGAGNGVFPPASIDLGGRGRRGSDFKKVVGSNEDSLAVGADTSGSAPICQVVGSMVGNADPELKRCEPAGPNANAVCTTDGECPDDPGCSDGVCNCVSVAETSLALALNVTGPIVNQPPTANAGADQVVECNLAGGASFQLRSLSTDPDGNIALTRWYLNSRSGPQVGVSPEPRLVQGVGTASYVVRVIDALAQADEDTTQVQVVDTTPPALFCNAPPAIRPGQHDLSYTGTAEDVCDPAATPVVTGYRCEKNGKAHPCKVALAGDTITLVNPSGVGTRIVWELRVTDASGNVATKTCAVDVANPSGQ